MGSPEGIILEQKFKKDDSGKILAAALEPKFLLGTANVLTFGARKYGRNNWKKVEDRIRYEDALLRHTYAYLSGEKIDVESGLSHLYHMSCNLMFLDWIDNNEPK